MSTTASRSSSPVRPLHARGSSSPRLITSPLLTASTSVFDSPDLGRRGSSTFLGLEPRSRKRGLTLDEVEEYGLVTDEKRSDEFRNMPVTEEEIGKLPKKLRGYYSHMALIYQHYLEVEGLLQGDVATDIANSFEASKGRSRGREGAASGIIKMKGKDKNVTVLNEDIDEEAGETTGLLSASEKEEKRERIATLALNVNTIVNVLLVATKVVAVLYSSSISLTASLVDSALDLLSTFIILGTSWAIGLKTDQHLYPAGKRRFEPLGVLIFSVAMIASFVQVFIESFERAIGRQGEPAVELSWIGMGTMLATIGVKAILWVWCSRIPSSGVQALAQDAENDVWLNIMSLFFPYLGTKLNWRLLDPIGGMVLSTYITVEWIKTLLQNFANLSGRSAGGDQISRVLYLVTRFNPVLEIGDVECYHIGDEYIVEVDVILPSTSTLHFAHDVGETIQCVLESLDGVLRAYVHCDYSSRNPPQHTPRVAAGTTASNIPSKLASGYAATDVVSKPGSSDRSATPRPRFLEDEIGRMTMSSAPSQPLAEVGSEASQRT